MVDRYGHTLTLHERRPAKFCVYRIWTLCANVSLPQRWQLTIRRLLTMTVNGTVNGAAKPLNTALVRKQFPGLQKGSVCLNNGSGALVLQGAIESISRTMSDPHMNLRGLDSKSRPDVEIRKANYATLASFMNAEPDEIGE
ncbi:Nonribosomal peptide synthetase fmpE [Pseudocercospora fuligena]|uniref:Nonribosomal peptide synthetase fmpE n=1 Tax=Pseudocercospora fuligena TaxID=685502 RepID=A0A8H6VI25_9PEZI|nr:Nonribosomal peptide synthetase fmpE [Pseudocercospora fuligena]